ncbi:MAG TPA: hypothetical protein DEV72_03335 [Ktedonobacter sp.]|jgi:hypothetical protein|nr:hypothetical protein [Ktedonobacter sp.]
MRNTTLYYGAIVLGVIALIVGVFYLNNIIVGFHPTRAYIAFGIGVVLLIIGIVGAVVARPKV